MIEFVRRDLQSLKARLARPKFAKAAPVYDDEAYALGAVRKKVLRGVPFTVTLVDAGGVSDTKYRPEKRGRIGDKVQSIERVAAKTGASLQVFNDFPIKQKGDVVALRAASVNENARLIIILIANEAAAGVYSLFNAARGERAIFHGDWFALDGLNDYVETFSDNDLNSCELRAAVVELVEVRLDEHVADQVR